MCPVPEIFSLLSLTESGPGRETIRAHFRLLTAPGLPLREIRDFPLAIIFLVLIILWLTFPDDGSVRVWRNIEGENYSDKSLEMVTAWQALSGMLPSTRGMHVTDLVFTLEPNFENL